MAYVLIQIIILVLTVDFLVAVIHWGMDRFGDPKCPLLGERVFGPNELHHIRPAAFLKNSIWKNSDTLLIVALVIIILTWLAGVLTWQVWVFVAVIAVTNVIHRWAHQTRHENGCLISLLQDLYIIQRREEHGRHHRGDQDTHYAAVTNILNPVLEAINFWRTLECLVECIFKVQPRRFLPLRLAMHPAA